MTTTPERSATLTELVAVEVLAQMGRRRVRQRELARRLGENDQWVSTRLNGRTPINLNDLHRFAVALDVSVYELLPPAETAAKAVGPQAIAQYLGVAVRTTDRRQRPTDNRPIGHPLSGRVPAIGRTTYLARGPRAPRA